nr:autotransporter outer membrane beta-barrel domain-containing protein [Parachlamydia sp. AcF125]
MVIIQAAFCIEIPWTGGISEDALTTSNWDLNTLPGSDDTAVFSSSGFIFTPTLSGSPATDIRMGTLQFVDTACYNFILQFTTSRQFRLQQVGVANSGTSEQVFSIHGSNSIFRFENNSSADATQSGKIFYELTNVGRLRFANSATASNANINLKASGGLLEFFSTSTAGNAQITMTGDRSTATFFNNSRGGSATITSTDKGNIAFTNTSKAQNIRIFADKTTLSFKGASQANSAQVLAINGSRVTFSGNSMANTSTILTHASSVIFEETASGGEAAINLHSQSQLQFNQHNTLGSLSADSSSSIHLNAFQLSLGANHTDSTIEGTISGIGGSLAKKGSGRLILNGNHTFTGCTDIQGGTLAGTGSINGDLTIQTGAIFVPGNHMVGTFNIAGNYLQSAESVLAASIDGSGQSSLVDAQGLASINGNLNIHSPDGQYHVGTPYLIVRGQKGRNGTFSSCSVTNPYFLPSLEYDAAHVFLTLKTNFNPFAANQNQRNVARQIDQLLQPDYSQQALIHHLGTLTPGQLQKRLAQYSGAQYVSLIQSLQFSHHRLIQRLSALNLCLPVCCQGGSPLTFWAQGSGERGFISNSHRTPGLKSTTWNINLGGFKYLGLHLALGASVNYEFNQINFKLGGNAKVHQTQGILFALYQHPSFYALANLIGGGGNCKIKRLAFIKNERIRPSTNPFLANGAAYFELGKTFCASKVKWQPFLGLDLSYFHQQSSIERHGKILNLKILHKKLSTIKSRMGFHVRGDFDGLEIKVGFDWRYAFKGFQNEMRVQFKNFGDSFKVQGAPLHRHSFESFLQAKKQIFPGVQLYGQLAGEKGHCFSNYQASLGLNAFY